MAAATLLHLQDFGRTGLEHPLLLLCELRRLVLLDGGRLLLELATPLGRRRFALDEREDRRAAFRLRSRGWVEQGGALSVEGRLDRRLGLDSGGGGVVTKTCAPYFSESSSCVCSVASARNEAKPCAIARGAVEIAPCRPY